MLKIVVISLMAVLFYSNSLFAEKINWQLAHEKEYSYTYEDINKLQNEDSFTSKYIYALRMLSETNDKKAEEIFSYLLAVDTSSIESRWGLAEISRRRYLLNESAEELDEIIKIQSDFVPAKISRAYLYFEEEKYKDAIKLAKEVLKKGEEKVDTANIVRAHLIIGGAKGMLAEKAFVVTKVSRGLNALSHLKAARKIAPDDPGVLYAWGSYYLKAPGIAGGDIEKSEKFLLKALEKSPKFTDVYARLAQLYLEQKDKENFNKYIELALHLDKHNKLLKEILAIGASHE